MKLFDIVIADTVIPELHATHRSSVIAEMVDALAAPLGLQSHQA